MASEKRQLPKSNIKRNIALAAAKARNDELVLAGIGYLTTGINSTTAKLEYIEPLYRNAFNLVAKTYSAEMLATTNKNDSITKLKKGCSRFIRVFALAVDDDEFPKSDFAFYSLDSNGNVPLMNTEEEIKTVAANLIAGEAARVAAGGTPMGFPSISVIIARNTLLQSDASAQRFASDVFVNAERALKALNPKADEALLFVYNEMETHFSNLPKSAIRDEGRKWGIKYVKKGSKKKVSGKVLDSITMLQIIRADVSFANGNNDDLSTDTGYSLDTTLMNVQQLTATCAGYMPFAEDVTLIENENLVYDIIMVKII
jgi:hypothetical protein